MKTIARLQFGQIRKATFLSSWWNWICKLLSVGCLSRIRLRCTGFVSFWYIWRYSSYFLVFHSDFLNSFVLFPLQKQPSISYPVVDDGITWNSPVPDFHADAQKLFDTYVTDMATDDEKSKLTPPPDNNLTSSPETMWAAYTYKHIWLWLCQDFCSYWFSVQEQVKGWLRWRWDHLHLHTFVIIVERFNRYDTYHFRFKTRVDRALHFFRVLFNFCCSAYAILLMRVDFHRWLPVFKQIWIRMLSTP